MYESLSQLAAERRRRRETRTHDLRRQRDERERIAIERIPRLRQLLEDITSMPGKLADLTLAPQHNGQPERLKMAVATLIEQGRQLTKEKEQLLVQAGFGPKWLEVWWHCEKCQDTGVTEHRYSDGTFDPPEKCDCVRKEELDDIMRAAGLVGPLGDQTFDNWDPAVIPDSDRRVMVKIQQYCYDYARRVAEGKANRGLVLLGGVGLGKTFMCAAMTHLVASHYKSVAYFTMSEFMDFSRRSRFDRDRDGGEAFQMYTRVQESALLVLDDVGQERITDFTSEEFFTLLNLRVNRGLPIVVSSNLSPSEIDDRYGERIASRLFGFCDVLRFVGQDVRRRLREASL